VKRFISEVQINIPRSVGEGGGKGILPVAHLPGRDLGPEDFKNVPGLGYHVSAFFEQTIDSGAGGCVDRAGNGEYFPPLLQGKVDCDQGTASFGGFHDQHPATHAADDAVATGKVP
jgi:hypothetical protein